MNFKRFSAIGDCEPRAWNKGVPGTRFDDYEDDEVPVPYCDDFDDESRDGDAEDGECEEDTETETDSVSSCSGKPVKRVCVSLVLQEESDFMSE